MYINQVPSWNDRKVDAAPLADVDLEAVLEALAAQAPAEATLAGVDADGVELEGVPGVPVADELLSFNCFPS